MKYGLAFSGGKDSWACLYLHLEQIQDIHVIWVNTGKNYPETLEQVEIAKKLCPTFIEISSNRDLQNDAHGIPADYVPIRWTETGQIFSGAKPFKVQSYLGCCYQNISEPLNAKVKELGITHLISGQRADEVHKSARRNGDVVDDVTHLFPLENWTEEQVFDYLKDKMEIPEHFGLSHSSLDCYDCSAYLEESSDRLVWAKNKHPDLHEINMQRINKLRYATAGVGKLYQLEGIDNG